jgi:nucleoside-diphosphate-sugar epimerase
MNSPLITLTGATGFIGRALLTDLRAHGYRVRVLLRRPVDRMPDADSAVIGDLVRPMNLSSALEGAEVVIHSAALNEAMSGRPEDDYRAINTDATVALANAARRAGVRRFIFLSSVRAQTGPSAVGVVDENLPPAPTDAYGRSKLAAEEGLANVGIEWAALRSVLVYGPGVGGNMATLLRIARSHWPLPIPHSLGRRSLLAVENLAEAVRTMISTDQPIRRAFLVADDGALDIAEIIAHLRAGYGRRAVTLPVPSNVFRLAADFLGYSKFYDHLTRDLIVDNSQLKSLGWRPQTTSQDGLRRLGGTLRQRLLHEERS